MFPTDYLNSRNFKTDIMNTSLILVAVAVAIFSLCSAAPEGKYSSYIAKMSRGERNTWRRS